MTCRKCKYWNYISRQEVYESGFHYCDKLGGDGYSLKLRKLYCGGSKFEPKDKKAMTKNQEELLEAICKAKLAQEFAYSIRFLVESTIGGDTPLCKEAKSIIECLDALVDILQRFFGKKTYFISDESKEDFFYWINNDKHPDHK